MKINKAYEQTKQELNKINHALIENQNMKQRVEENLIKIAKILKSPETTPKSKSEMINSRRKLNMVYYILTNNDRRLIGTAKNIMERAIKDRAKSLPGCPIRASGRN